MVDTVASLLQAELETRGWAQADLARVLSWPAQAMSEVMQAKRKIDAALALDLEALTGRSAEAWLRVQLDQELTDARRMFSGSERLALIEARAELESAVPVRELIRRGAVSSGHPLDQAEQVRRLIGDDPTFGASAKRSKNALPFTRAQTAWIALARRQAQAVDVATFNRDTFVSMVVELPRMVTQPEHFHALPQRFSRVGVALVHVKPLPGGRIDGVSLRIEDHPMIALSGRGKRLDKVLFALLHECAHIIQGHWTQAPRVHEAGDEQVVGDHAAEASVSALAESWCFPNGLAVNRPLTKQVVGELARVNGVSPALVVGHLQHHRVIDWSTSLGRGLPTVEEALATWP